MMHTKSDFGLENEIVFEYLSEKQYNNNTTFKFYFYPL